MAVGTFSSRLKRTDQQCFALSLAVSFHTLQRHAAELTVKPQLENTWVNPAPSPQYIYLITLCENSRTQKQRFSVRTALALFILSFNAPVPPIMAPWLHLRNITNRPCLGHTESLAFHTEAAQLSSRFWAWQHSCHSNQNKRFILRDLARQTFPWAKAKGSAPFPRHTTITDTHERKIQQEPAHNIKARTSQVHGDGGSWRMKGPQTPPHHPHPRPYTSWPLHIILLGLLQGKKKD